MEGDLKKEFDLLEIYLKKYIDECRPVLLDYQICIYGKHGYIEYGHNGKNFPTFKQWKIIWKDKF